MEGITMATVLAKLTELYQNPTEEEASTEEDSV